MTQSPSIFRWPTASGKGTMGCVPARLQAPQFGWPACNVSAVFAKRTASAVKSEHSVELEVQLLHPVVSPSSAAASSPLCSISKARTSAGVATAAAREASSPANNACAAKVSRVSPGPRSPGG